MTGQIALGKVTIFMTRKASTRLAHERELLVFRHPFAGVQLPAGTIEAGESPEAAALRETWEETGLVNVRIVAALGEEAQAMAPGTHMVLRRVPLLQNPWPEAAEVVSPFATYLGLRRGLPVSQIGKPEAGYTPVAYEEYDGPTHEFDAPSRSISGWVESDALTPQIVRHYFHAIPTAPTPDEWVQNAEEWQHRFELFWVPLLAPYSSSSGLIPAHGEWLEEYGDLLASFDRP